MRNDPTISVVTVTFNAAETIRRTVESVLSQSDPADEYIVIDGGSTDGTLVILREYAARGVLTMISEKDDGIYDAFNKGVRLSSCEIVGILNAGDWFDSNTLTSVRQEFKHCSADILCGLVRYHHDNEAAHYWLPAPEKLSREMTIGHPAAFVRSPVYRSRVGLFDTRYRIAGDYDFFARAYKLGVSMAVTSKVVVNMTSGGASWINWRKSFDEAAMIRREHFNASNAYRIYQIGRALATRLLNRLGLGFLANFYRRYWAAIPKQNDRPSFPTRIVVAPATDLHRK